VDFHLKEIDQEEQSCSSFFIAKGLKFKIGRFKYYVFLQYKIEGYLYVIFSKDNYLYQNTAKRENYLIKMVLFQEIVGF
jgi:hypothetical protein